MSEVTLRQLEYFLATLDGGSITHAARTCRVSQAAVSLALNHLEAVLGLKLIIRRKAKGVAPTHAGEVVAAKARLLLNGTTDLVATVHELQGAVSGPLRLGCFFTLSPDVMPPVLQYFDENHPALDVDFVEGKSLEIQDQMLAGKLDACILFSKHLHPQAKAVEIVEVRPKVLIRRDHALAEHDAVSLSDLASEPATLVDHAPGVGIFEEMLQATGIEPNIKWRSKDVHTIRSMVSHGLGYSVVFFPRDYEGDPLVARPIAEELPRNSIVVALPDAERLPLKLQKLIDFCRTRFGGRMTPELHA